VALVLCTGRNPVLLYTPKLILEGAGHSVIATENESAVKTICRQYQFDVAVIGQTLSPEDKRKVFSAVRECCPSTKVLELFAEFHGRTLQEAGSWLQVPVDAPGKLAQRVAELLSENSSTKTYS